ncbi:unnamed protein product [Dovyalis caffra]|uniref:Uncharacterized protein n=1 Tax=Dovyalis caffra TaxID=77055 RepID=A0AAV1S3I0_9ROSI|nr:unnamed protein product [Dovyalis caffra]
MDDLPLQKITISGPTLSALMHRITTSLGDVDGLLFGHVTQLTPSTLTDDNTPQNPDSNLIATITSFFCPNSPLSFYDSIGRVDSVPLHRFLSSTAIHQRNSSSSSSNFLGWFSARRKSPIRPSMREFFVSQSLNTLKTVENGEKGLNPCVFLLFTTPVQGELLYHTHEYRAYQFRINSRCFEPKTIGIDNIGPDFRGNYGCFSPNSPFPELNCELRGISVMNEDRNDEVGKSLGGVKKISRDQKELGMIAEGFDVGDLGKLMGSETGNNTMGLEHLYEKMLVKLDNLARQVEKSNAKVLEMFESKRRKACLNGSQESLYSVAALLLISYSMPSALRQYRLL